MNKNVLTTALTLLCLTLATQAQEARKTKANLNNVTVFFAGAELSQTASAVLSRGENEITITGISPVIDRNSLKIKTSNGSVISLSEFSVDYLSADKAQTPTAIRLKDSLDIYRKRLDNVNNALNISSSMKDMLQKGVASNMAGTQQRMATTQEMTTLMSFYESKANELINSETANNVKKTELEKTINRLQNQYNQEQMKNNRSSGMLKLTLSSPVAGNCNFSISYYTPAARWTPYYDINVPSTDKPVQIAMKSKVSQTTGMDWEKVKLTLSTTTPSQGKNAPVLNTWFVDYLVFSAMAAPMMAKMSVSENVIAVDEVAELREAPIRIRSGRAADNQAPIYIVDGARVDADYYNSIDPSMIKDRQVLNGDEAVSRYGTDAAGGVFVASLKSSMDDYVTQSDNDLNMSFDIDMPYTIPGNGKEQTIELQNKEAMAEYKYLAVPKLDPEVYVVGEIADWQKLSLLSGRANVTYDGTYVGESYIDASSTKDKLNLTLGTDKRVTVKREKLQDFSSTRFLGSDTKQVFTYRVTVKNNQNKPIKLELKDQYPISTQKSIEVELITKDTTPWTENNDQTGIITWNVDLKAGETKIYQISYSVKYPKDKRLNL